MATFLERLNSAMIYFRVFGLCLDVDGALATAVDALLVLANVSYSVYGFHHVTSVIRQTIPLIWDINMVMGVVKVYTYLLAPMVTLAMWQYKKRSLTDAMHGLDGAVPPETVAAAPPGPFIWYSVAWLGLSVTLEWAAYLMFHVDTGFVHFSAAEYAMIVVYNVWATVPLLVYVFAVDTVRMAVRDINGRLTTVADWRAYRGRWEVLRHTAVHLARDQFGVTIVAFVVCTISEIVYYMFSLYVLGYKIHGQGQQHVYRRTVYFVYALFSASWMFEIIRMTENCKLELLKTPKVLNSINISSNSDYKEMKYTSLNMLHLDFSFMPCNIFEMNYRSLKSIATLIAAFIIFQIQMKLS